MRIFNPDSSSQPLAVPSWSPHSGALHDSRCSRHAATVGFPAERPAFEVLFPPGSWAVSDLTSDVDVSDWNDANRAQLLVRCCTLISFAAPLFSIIAGLNAPTARDHLPVNFQSVELPPSPIVDIRLTNICAAIVSFNLRRIAL